MTDPAVDVPPPVEPAERRASEELLRQIDTAMADLRSATAGLDMAREQYRKRLHGTRGDRS